MRFFKHYVATLVIADDSTSCHKTIEQTLIQVGTKLISAMHQCDWIWENPPYGINTRFAQCAFIVPQVKICKIPVFVIVVSRSLFSTCYHQLPRPNVSY